MTIPRWYAAAGPAYLAALLALDTQRRLPRAARARRDHLARAARRAAAAAAARARAGARRRRLRDGRRGDGLARLGRLPLPAAQPAALHPARPRDRLPERARARRARARPPRSSQPPPSARSAGASPGSPCCRASTWRARSACRCSASSSGARAPAPTYAGVFLVVAALELYGTSIGTWRWARSCPGSGSPTATRRRASRPATCGST